MTAWRVSAVCALAWLGPAAADAGGLRGAAEEAASAGAPPDEAELIPGSPSEALAWELADNSSEDLEAAARELPGNGSAIAADGEEPALEKSAQWRHHHSGQIMTLYHTTSPEAASAILSSGFLRGAAGWCGGAIYFIATPVLPPSKYVPSTHPGAVIQARVDTGRMTTMDRRCSSLYGTGMITARRKRRPKQRPRSPWGFGGAGFAGGSDNAGGSKYAGGSNAGAGDSKYAGGSYGGAGGSKSGGNWGSGGSWASRGGGGGGGGWRNTGGAEYVTWSSDRVLSMRLCK